MKKKVIALLAAASMVAVMLAGCGSKPAESAAPAESKEEAAQETAGEAAPAGNFKVGAVLVGDENEGYTYAHIMGLEKAMERQGMTKDQIIWKYCIPEDESCYDAIKDCIESGCSLVITNSYGHQSFAQQAAEEFPDVQIVSMTGDTAKASGLPNFKNAFTRIYEARYVGGIIAGMKLAELDEAGLIKDSNKAADGTVKVGYVGAYPYAEVVSGYTAFFLGIQSVYPNVSMDVQYTNSWFNITAENEAALALIDSGCVIIGQHADSTGAPSACEEKLNAGTTVYSVGYNVDMLSVAPNAALTSPTNEWVEYYDYALGCAKEGAAIDTNWAEGFASNAVAVTELGKSCAEGTQEAVDAAIAAIIAGELKVFDTTTFTVGGEEVKSAFATDSDGDWTPDCDEAIFDGCYNESYFQSAPSFQLRIDGINELN